MTGFKFAITGHVNSRLFFSFVLDVVSIYITLSLPTVPITLSLCLSLLSAMTADVSYIVRILGRYNDDRMTAKDSSGPGSSVALMTRDLLGSAGCGGDDHDHDLELDLDLKVPNGWEKRLDLKVRCFAFSIICFYLMLSERFK